MPFGQEGRPHDVQTPRPVRLPGEKDQAGQWQEDGGDRQASPYWKTRQGKRKRKEGRHCSSRQEREQHPPGLSKGPTSGDGDGHGATATPSPGYRVPGAAAPVSNVMRIWNPLLRWILGSRTTFAKFLHSVICNSPSVEEGTATSIWPMSPPYPWLMKRIEANEGDHGEQQDVIRRAMNVVVLTLSCFTWDSHESLHVRSGLAES